MKHNLMTCLGNTLGLQQHFSVQFTTFKSQTSLNRLKLEQHSRCRQTNYQYVHYFQLRTPDTPNTARFWNCTVLFIRRLEGTVDGSAVFYAVTLRD